jgi:hypothetical protein
MVRLCRLRLVLAGVLVAAPSAAQGGDVGAAREAYDRGAAAYNAGDYVTATAQLSKADALVPNDVALELALRAAVKANDPVDAMELAVRADPRRSATLTAARDDARAKMGGRVGKLTVTCAPGSSCTATVDDAIVPTGEARFVVTGAHQVVITSHGRAQTQTVRIDSGATVAVEGRPAPVEPAAPVPERREGGGLSSGWIWAGAGLTAVLGGITVASALDTAAKHDDFAAHPSADGSAAGSDAQLRTNLLAAGTVACAVVTLVVGLVFVRGHDAGSRGERR